MKRDILSVAVSPMVSPSPRCISPGLRYIACPLSCSIAASSDMRVLVLGFSKIIPSNFFSENFTVLSFFNFMAIMEKKHRFENLKMAYMGDGNNVSNSLLLGAAITGMDISVACPEHHEPDKDILYRARDIALKTGSRIEIVKDPRTAVDSADIIYTDVWVSMGEEKVRAQKEKLFVGYQVNDELADFADKNYIFMHCLPARRGLEVTDEIIDGIHSVVLDEAENRLYSEKGVIYTVLS